MKWHVIFYKDQDGNQPVKDFILSQSHKAIGEIIHVIDLLYQFEFTLGPPYVEHIDGKIWALRIKHSSDIFRIFYFAYTDNKFVLLHAVKKKTTRLSSRDIELAKDRMSAHESGL